ncbi:hypothetical protein D3C81_2005530 [compost metagenome]
MGSVGIGGRFEQVIDGRARVMQPRLQAQGKAAVLLYRQVIPGRGKIQSASIDRRFVARLKHRQGYPPGKHFGQLTAALIGQVQNHDNRQCETFAQRAENTQQRFDASGGGTDDDRFNSR